METAGTLGLGGRGLGLVRSVLVWLNRLATELVGLGFIEFRV